MTNHNPVAGDFTFYNAFTPAITGGNLYYDDTILEQTKRTDADGDTVHLTAVNGQRITPVTNPDNPADTVIHGEYGTLTVDANGYFGYVYDQSNPAVQAMEANGGKLVDHFTFKVSDGRGGTDFGYFNIAEEAPQTGTTTITFDDTDSGFPYIYKGLQWGQLTDEPPYIVKNGGNSFAATTTDTSDVPIWSSTGQPVTFDSIDVSTYAGPTANVGAHVTFVGTDADGGGHSLTVSIDPGSLNYDMSHADHIDLSSLGPLEQLSILFSFDNYDNEPVLTFDNLAITV